MDFTFKVLHIDCMFWWDVRNIGNGSELVSSIVLSLLQILVCSCSVLTAMHHGMLTLAHLFSFITLWPSDNKVSSV